MDEDIKSVLSHEVSGPPLGIRAADIIERGGRIRRRRKRLAVAGSSLATAAVIVFGAVAVGGRGGEGTAPVQPAGPGLSTISPAPVTPAPSEVAPPAEVSPREPSARPSQTRSTPKTSQPGRTTTAVPPRVPTATKPSNVEPPAPGKTTDGVR
ncbi:hypothetical protein ACFQ05_14555 [Amycolatopsis umgeniensis]|uniref:Uncharacterized protein n=1 Tax=Amycolatopsis umgeniensis TaxID=336628 RepID=A0A841B5E1_9PSEU|nr:hypothetical protein [Amycolatopsis umgeniensis]MBB5854527.1 hypothetical protein [Amycolatopsis umgeniensis]